jgi:hypothetical protein
MRIFKGLTDSLPFYEIIRQTKIQPKLKQDTYLNRLLVNYLLWEKDVTVYFLKRK